MPIVSAPRRALGKSSTRPRSLANPLAEGVIVFTRGRANCSVVRGHANGHREGGWEVYDFYSETKTIYVDHSGTPQRAQIDTYAE